MINVDLSEAKEIVAERSNGSLTGISTAKGGRAWLDGEWQLDELEALCVVIRKQCEAEGVTAVGAEELILHWKANNI